MPMHNSLVSEFLSSQYSISFSRRVKGAQLEWNCLKSQSKEAVGSSSGGSP